MSIQSSVNQVIGFVAAGTALGKESAANRYKRQRELHSQFKRGYAANKYPEVMKSLETNELMMDVQEAKAAPNSIADYNKLTKGVKGHIEGYVNDVQAIKAGEAAIEEGIKATAPRDDEYVPQTPEDVEAMAYQSANPEAVAQNKALMATQNAINEQHRMKDVARRRISDKMPKGREAKRIKSGGDN